jgi:hypothetical protein
MREALDEMARLDFADELDKLSRFQFRRAELGEWADGLLWSHSTMRLTFDELKEFFESYIGLLYRYKRPDEECPPGARDIRVRLLAFPEPDAPPAEETPDPDGS